MKKLFLFTSICLMIFSGCATTKDVSPQYVSSMKYSSYDCNQLKQELYRVQSKVAESETNLKKSYDKHTKQAVASALFFWPGLFLINDSKGQEEELAKMKGKYEAIEAASRFKGCEMRYVN